MIGSQLEIYDVVREKTQEDMILEHLQSGRKITPLEALENYGCMRLASRISDLKRKGFNVISETVYSGEKHYASYSL